MSSLLYNIFEHWFSSQTLSIPMRTGLVICQFIFNIQSYTSLYSGILKSATIWKKTAISHSSAPSNVCRDAHSWHQIRFVVLVTYLTKEIVL